MISVSNVSMRYGAKVLFEEVSTAFTPGKRYGLTGPNGAGKTTFMNLLSGEFEPQKGNVVRPRELSVLRQDQFAFDAYRVIDTVIMGNKRLWKAMEERNHIYEKPEMSNEDGMRLANSKASWAKRTDTRPRPTRPFCCKGSTSLTICMSGRWVRFRADKKCACCWRRRSSDIRRRCCWTSPRTILISIPSTGFRIFSTAMTAC